MKHEEFPRLELTFAEDGEHPFLIDACFRLDGSLPASRKLVEQPPRGKSFRALCILMLLAKHRGENPGGDENISFFAGGDRPTWIKTLGTSFGRLVQQEFFEKYFHNRKFLSASRGSGHTQENRKAGGGVYPCAKYHTPQLRLHNLRFFKRQRNASGAAAKAMTEDDLALFAEKLERHEIGKGEGWEAIVPEIVAKTKQDRPLKPDKSPNMAPPEGDEGPSPFILTARWRDLGNAVRKEIEGRVRGGNWYVVCVTPSWLLDWKGIFFDAVVRHDAKIKFAYHSPTAASCPSVKAQWRMNFGYVDTDKPVDYVRSRLKTLKLEMGSWAAEMRKKSLERGSPKGSFEFYESYIAHPFMAILSVPPSSNRVSKPVPKAPAGTWCVLGLYPLYAADLDGRCGLYLHRPSPMLDVYYNSILRLFERGPQDGYFKPVNLLRSPSGKGA